MFGFSLHINDAHWRRHCCGVAEVKLIENWRKAHRMSSMQLMALAIVADGLLSALDRYGYQVMSPGWQTAVTLALIAAAMAARLVAQESVK